LSTGSHSSTSIPTEATNIYLYYELYFCFFDDDGIFSLSSFRHLPLLRPFCSIVFLKNIVNINRSIRYVIVIFFKPCAWHSHFSCDNLDIRI
jgi:hypothetical protein